MSAKKSGAIELPAHPKDKEFEEHIAAYLQCAGFPEVFKVYGWLKYLEIERGALVVKDAKETPEAQQFYADKANTLNIDLVVADPLGDTDTAIAGLPATEARVLKRTRTRRSHPRMR
jgi:hypothetical protein